MINFKDSDKIMKTDFYPVTFNPDNYRLVFGKSVYDMAFIITHESLITKIDIYQSHFQSVHKFSTHCIYIEDTSKIQLCLGDLKQYDVSYAIVIYEKSESCNSYDFYILYRSEALISISIEKINILVSKDFTNLMMKVKLMKNDPLKSPHPVATDENELSYMNDELRYYLCLLFDHRLLTMMELQYVHRHLLFKKMLLTKAMETNHNFFNGRSLEASRQEKPKYCINEQLSHDNKKEVFDEGMKNLQSSSNISQMDSIKPSKFVFKGPNRTSSIIQMSEISEKSRKHYSSKESARGHTIHKLKVDMPIKKKRIRIRQRKITKSKRKSSKHCREEEMHTHSKKRLPIYKADIISQKFRSYSQTIKTVKISFCKSSKVQLSYDKAKISDERAIRKDDSCIVSYCQTNYFRNASKLELEYLKKSGSQSNQCTIDKVKSLVKTQSLKSTRSLQLLTSCDVIDLTDDNDETETVSILFASKRKSNESAILPSKFIRPSYFSPLIPTDPVTNTVPSQIKSSPYNLLNLFRLILNLVPLELSHDNAVSKILSSSFILIQDGIKEPALKNVAINYSTCRTNGFQEIVSNIYSIYNESEKPLNDTSYMIFIWNLYFPKHVTNFNMIILFYKFIRLLMLYTIFNKSNETKKLVSNVIDQIDVIVHFDFKISVTSIKKDTLQCLTKTFEKYFKEHDQLHVLYTYLPIPEHLPPPDKNKKLDDVIRKKKIEFTISSLLHYFVLSINLIHREMAPYEIEIIYGAIRTLRFCLRKINSTLVQTVFNKPKSFDFTEGNNVNDINELSRELQFLLKEIKHYQCILFTENHYEFINCILDFACMIEGNVDVNKPLSGDPVMYLNADEFIESFTKFETILEYHSESELEFLMKSLRKHWTDILHQAFIGTNPEPCGRRIIKEMNILLPNKWGLNIFNEALNEAAKLYYTEYQKLAGLDPLNWYTKFQQAKPCASLWLSKYNLPFSNADVFYNYQLILENQYSGNLQL